MTQLHIHYYFGYKNNGVLWIHTFYLKAITIKDKFIIYLFGDLFTLLLEEKTKKRIPKSTSKERRDVYKQFSGYEENILHLCKHLIERKSYYNFEKLFMKLNSLTLVIDRSLILSNLFMMSLGVVSFMFLLFEVHWAFL